MSTPNPKKSMMRFLFVFFAFLVSLGIAEKRRCPACVDHAFVKYFDDHPFVFHDEYRQIYIPENIDEFQCEEDKFTTVTCFHSCLRVHLRDINKKRNYFTRGWMYTCSTNIIKKAPNQPSGLNRYNDDFSYIDIISQTISFEVTFYSHAERVEKPDEYKFRISGLNRYIYNIYKHLSAVRVLYFFFYLVGLLVSIYFAWMLLSACIVYCKECCSKTPKEDPLEFHELMEGQVLNTGKEENVPSTSTQTDAVTAV